MAENIFDVLDKINSEVPENIDDIELAEAVDYTPGTDAYYFKAMSKWYLISRFYHDHVDPSETRYLRVDAPSDGSDPRGHKSRDWGYKETERLGIQPRLLASILKGLLKHPEKLGGYRYANDITGQELAQMIIDCLLAVL